jgi:hypothetical protein
MIDPLNEILHDLIQSRVPRLAGPTQVGFVPPNEDWQQEVISTSEERLNLYLYDLRENLKLRSNARTREPENGWYVERQSPPRLDCHYLITGWSPVTQMPAIEPTRDEHVLLYEVLEVLMRHRPLIPAEVYKPGVVVPSGNTPSSVPAPLFHEELPLEVALPDGLHNLGDFWSTMKVVWRPALQLTVTIPVLLLQPDLEAPMVTTVIGDYRERDAFETSEVWVSIGGHVLAGTQPQAVQGAWVQILGLTPAEVQVVNRRMVTRADGRFLFARLRPGRYRLRAVAPGLGDLPRDVDLPSETGEYDLRFP